MSQVAASHIECSTYSSRFAMSMRASPVLLPLLAGLLVAPACDEDEGHPPFETSVDEGKPLGDLDESEQADFCEDATAWVSQPEVADDLRRVACFSAGISGGYTDESGEFDRAGCQQAYEACLDDLGDLEAAECNFSDLQCEVSVGEYISCQEEALRLASELLGSFSCETFDPVEFAEQNQDLTQLPPACEALYESCPELGGDDSSEPGE